MTEENFSNFVLAHDDDDPARLLLSAGRWPDIDVRRAARAIEARRKVRDKIPSWLAHPAIDYPSSLSLEQCSSEETARYKQAFVPAGKADAADSGAVADLTGGLGADTWPDTISPSWGSATSPCTKATAWPGSEATPAASD